MLERRIFSLLLSIALVGILADTANATRLSADLKQLVEQNFPGVKVRIDGALELKNGDLLLAASMYRNGLSRKRNLPILIKANRRWFFITMAGAT